ncbi:UNC-like C-terminal-domain-containing protein [Spinellus fusiger]|nr:UNC-like C-terminal-domain-containing protein [Spinellus fusiger]
MSHFHVVTFLIFCVFSLLPLGYHCSQEICPKFQLNDNFNHQCSVTNSLINSSSFIPLVSNSSAVKDTIEAIAYKSTTHEPSFEKTTTHDPVIDSSTYPSSIAAIDTPVLVNDSKTQAKEKKSEGNSKKKAPYVPILSFEDWQKKLHRTEEERQLKKKLAASSHGKNKKQQIIDSFDGGIEDDFGSVFEGFTRDTVKTAPNNIYAEKEYIEPKKSVPKASSMSSEKNIAQPNIKLLPVKALKERFNYASTDCAATIRASNKEAKGAHAILYESKDQYMLNKCSANKFVIINLCESILFDTIVLANFEFFSSTFKDFRVYVSDRYPTKKWKLLGQWQARNTRDLQVFRVDGRTGWSEYMKIEFLTHYGNEYYCPLSLVRVHGMPMMEYFNIVERKSLTEDAEDMLREEESLWPAEVREEIIQPMQDVVNTSEFIPLVPENEELEESTTMIPPVNVNNLSIDQKNEPSIYEEFYSDLLSDKLDKYLADESKDPQIHPTVSTPLPEYNHEYDEISSTPTHSSSFIGNGRIESTVTGIRHAKTSAPKNTNTCELQHDINFDYQSEAKELKLIPVNSLDNSKQTSTVFSKRVVHSIYSPTTIYQPTPIRYAPLGNIRTGEPTRFALGAKGKNSNIQESIYKTIMKRLNVLEVNATLSQRYLHEQNKMLNVVFSEMEKRHQDQLILLLGRLNNTAKARIDNMRRRYEERFEELESQTQLNTKEIKEKMEDLSEQITFQKYVSAVQLTLILSLFVYIVLPRNSAAMYSPILIDQKQQHKPSDSIETVDPKQERGKSIFQTMKNTDSGIKKRKPAKEGHLSETLVPNGLRLLLNPLKIRSYQPEELLYEEMQTVPSTYKDEHTERNTTIFKDQCVSVQESSFPDSLTPQENTSTLQNETASRSLMIDAIDLTTESTLLAAKKIELPEQKQLHPSIKHYLNQIVQPSSNKDTRSDEDQSVDKDQKDEKETHHDQ